MRSIADHLSSGLLVVDPELTVMAWNRWMTEHAEIAPETAIGQRLEALFPACPVATLKRRVKAALQLQSPSYLQPRKGYLFPVALDRIIDSHFTYMQQRIRILPNENAPHSAIIVIDDVTATREAEARAAEAADVSRRYLELIDNNVMTLGVDTEGRVTRASSALLQASGWTAEILRGTSLDTLGLGQLDVDEIAADDKLPERPVQRADGSTLWVRVRKARGLEDKEGDEQYLVLQDISLQMEIQALSERDTLTGAYNRMKFDQLLQAALSAETRYGQHFSLILCDIDHFKRINDNHGHLAGDGILKQFTSLLQSQIRSSDQLARWGGEEFVVLLPMTNAQEATAAAEKLRQAISTQSWPPIGKLSASFGVAFHVPNESADALLDRADGALYQAKEAGRDRVRLADSAAGEDN
ncbi:MAG: diguanylate cyclase [Lamprobacter sp.]|uniref:sensor domain-containing diguanylate cyclase n=1 Tax=Lamprobacter sp. TaxID=3100796 RepID=UPI002B261C90|nr:diguanylate cyclase [Lamprobacter sp.]MEA3639143.1 diguanylate cyclase [Lamprobacter sp.]